jgi:hypothetical protein
MKRLLSGQRGLFAALVGFTVLFSTSSVYGRSVERITFANGFDLICDHREQTGDRVRLYTGPDSTNFVEVAASDIAASETVILTDPPALPATAKKLSSGHADLTRAELREMLSSAGAEHNLDVNLLASVVHAESGGHSQAVSKAGAQGLMQLMPRTAAQLGVSDSFVPRENIAGGTAYLDALLVRYHDNLALALAAYNAGPAAVDRYHGVPPYRETRLYVARIIRDFNTAVKASRLPAPSPSSIAKADVAAAPHSGAVSH